MKLGKDFLILIALFALSAGVYYSGTKFHIPWYGASDFSQYYHMTLNPFNNDVGSPFAYRIFVPVIAHFIYESGLFYESSLTPYKDYYLSHKGIDYEPSVLSAIIFTNYILLAFAAFFTYKSTKVIFAQSNQTDHIMPVMLSSLIFFSFSTNVHGYAGLTEGGSFSFIFTLLLSTKKLSISFFFNLHFIYFSSRIDTACCNCLFSFCFCTKATILFHNRFSFSIYDVFCIKIILSNTRI